MLMCRGVGRFCVSRAANTCDEPIAVGYRLSHHLKVFWPSQCSLDMDRVCTEHHQQRLISSLWVPRDSEKSVEWAARRMDQDGSLDWRQISLWNGRLEGGSRGSAGRRQPIFTGKLHMGPRCGARPASPTTGSLINYPPYEITLNK